MVHRVLLLENKTPRRLESFIRLAGLIVAGSIGSTTVVCQRVVAGDKTAVSYETAIRPILKLTCFSCHGDDGTKEGGLDLRTVKLALKGGESGPSIVAGDAGSSSLLAKIKSGEMPAKGKAPTAVQIALIERWINEGAKTARAEPDDPNSIRFTEEERAYWAFQPVKAVAPPTNDRLVNVSIDRAANPIDRFLLSNLSKRGLDYSPEADRATLIRRAKFDLLGLPPTPEETAEFVNDRSPNAYEKLLDRYLASPHYGERWGRHWLDAAGFAESDGVTVEDRERPNAWRYRDYVFKSFNDDKPFDTFIRQQLAGDEMVGQAPNLADPNVIEALTATGFLRMAPDGTGVENTEVRRHEAVAETIKVVSSSLLGLSVGCAQCHSHRYDPISHEDYFGLRAVFDPAFDCSNWRTPDQRVVETTPPSDRKKIDEVEAEAKKLEADVRKRLTAIRAELVKIVEKNAPADRVKQIQVAAETPIDKRTPEQVKLIKEFPDAAVLTIELGLEGLLVEYDGRYKTKYDGEIKGMRRKIAETRSKAPARSYLSVCDEPGGKTPVTRLLKRGDHTQPAQPVKPSELAVLALHRNDAAIPEKDPKKPTSGRRTAYAALLTDGRHPLSTRVLINRVWLHHFGRGIVNTPADFGAFGERPEHPELLDWLADDFVVNGWKLKRIHKLLMSSAAYRQRSTRTTKLDGLDPDNRWLARMSIRRLEAEAIRDAVSFAVGNLKTTVGGPSVPVTPDFEGMPVTGRRSSDVFVGGETVTSVGDEEFRRSVYLQVRRKHPLPMLDAFDLPVMNPNCELRKSTNVPPQSLMLINGDFMLNQSQRLADRVFRERPADVDSRVERAWELIYSVKPTDAERKLCLDYLADQRALLEKSPRPNEAKPAEVKALATLCQALLGSNRFLYVD